MKRKIILAIFAAIELLFLGQWSTCVRFTEQFHFSSFDLSLRLIEGIHNDGSVPIFLVRLFHNRILGTIVDIYNNYTHYWDITFLLQLLSFVGVFGLLWSIWCNFRGKISKWVRILFVASLVIPIIEIVGILHFPFVLQLGLIAGPLLAMSFMGWWNFLADENKFKYGIFVALEMLSVLWLFSTLLQSNPMFCLR